MPVLRGLGIAVLAIVLALAAVAIGARFADGPVGILPGGPLVAGELVPESEIDWSFATDLDTIEFGLIEPPRSRTVWLIVHEGELYVPCGFLDVPLWKQWPHEALEDGRSLLRVAGKRYERQAVKIEDAELHAELARLVSAKYGTPGGQPPGPNDVWFFRMDRRTP